MKAAYTPIDCDFYDVLEALSTFRRICEIAYFMSEQEPMTAIIRGRITNLYALDGEEYMIVDNVVHIRLDALVRVDYDDKSNARPTSLERYFPPSDAGRCE